MKSLKTLKVVAAVIEKDQKIYATQRGYGDFKGGWEFPGGKVESGETYSEALKREIQEELNVEIEANDHICTVEFDYPTFHLSMEMLLVQNNDGKLNVSGTRSGKMVKQRSTL